MSTVSAQKNKGRAQAFVSVVTPFYNTEDYLGECIESVLAQSYDNWEYVLVNNRSTDRSLEIAQKYAAKDKRVRIVNNDTFLSQVQNYNHALTQISPTSKYCKVVQADDWIFSDCLTRMVEVAETNPAVGVVGAYGLFGPNVYLYGLPYPSTVVSGREICRLFFLDRIYLFGTPTSLLIRSDLIRARRPFYDEASPLEDGEICFELLKTCDFGFVHQVLTYSRRDNESILSSIKAYDPLLLLELMVLNKFGHTYLSDAEYRRCSRSVRRRYFRLIGENVLRQRPKKFWEFHQKGCDTIDLKLGPLRRLGCALYASLDLALNPKHTVERLAAHLRRRRASNVG
jgi:glycosyltransferase involved in cell wall biosynthesis